MGPYEKRAHRLALLVMAASLFVGVAAKAQDPAPTSGSVSSMPSSEGKKIGDFQVTQSIELGGRISDVSGSQPMYDTLVNDQTGLRILEQSLTMQSLTHEDLFDSLTLNSFGWGGDPEQAARLRISKYRWYTFTGSYQHIQNYFDYDLFANPLNPPTGTPYIPILNSPHQYFNTQNLYNFGLVALPMRKISFRVDYNRNRFVGPAFSSVHQGTDALTNQDWNNQLNGFRFGVDYRLDPKTTVSYTQLLQYFTGSTTDSLNSFNSWPLPNGTPVSLGLPWFNGGSPCSAPLNNGIANPSCNGFFGYGLYQHEHTFIPTEQLNFRSSALKWLDFNGQYQYSHAMMNTPLLETFSGLSSRTGVLGYNTDGSNSIAKWNSSSADVSATVHINDRLRLVETFRFRNFAVNGAFLDMENNFFGAAGTGSTSLLTPVATFPPTLLSHSSSSPADVINEFTLNTVAQDTKQNDLQVQYDVTRSFGVRAGFIYANDVIQPGNTYQAVLGDIYYPNNPNRGDCVGVPLNPDGSCTFTGILQTPDSPTTEINRYSGVIGAWFRKGSSLHANVDLQYGGADNWVYRIDPIRFFNIRGNVSYAPQPWLMLSGNLYFERATNDSSDLAFNQHNYSTTVSATIMPGKRWGLDLSYNFNAIQQNMNLCYTGAVIPTGSFTCVGDDTLMEVLGVYQTHTQYGSIAFTLNPIDRVAMRFGYSIVDNQGNTTQLNLLEPLGALSSTYQSPLAAIEIGLYKNVSFKGAWNYYQYGEGSFVGPTAPRYFHANNTTLALKYAF